MTASGQRREATATVTASSHESGEGDRVTTTGYVDLPGEAGTANTHAMTDIGPKTETSHTESGTGMAGSGQKTATGHAVRARANTT